MGSRNLMQMFADMNIPESVQEEYNALLVDIMEKFTAEMRRCSPEMKQLFRRIYYGGSYFDGLKVGSTPQEFDMNLVLQIDSKKLAIRGLESDPKKPNFAHLQLVGTPTSEEGQMLANSQYGAVLSPEKLFKLLQTAGDRALKNLNKRIVHRGQIYSVTRSIGAPFTLIISGNGKKFEADLVPAVEFSLDQLPANTKVRQRINQICQLRGRPFTKTTFLAICLWRADKDRFEIDFHDLEREILALPYPNVVKPIIRMMKMMRDNKGGAFMPLWSHLLKTSVMHSVLQHSDQGFWGERNLAQLCLLCLRELHLRLEQGAIYDIFFSQYNMLGRLKKKDQALGDVTRCFGTMIRRLEALSGPALDAALGELIIPRGGNTWGQESESRQAVAAEGLSLGSVAGIFGAAVLGIGAVVGLAAWGATRSRTSDDSDDDEQ